MASPDRLPWCGPVEDPVDATARLLARVRGTTTHGESARACGISLRTWMRWWAVLRELVQHAAWAREMGLDPAVVDLLALATQGAQRAA